MFDEEWMVDAAVLLVMENVGTLKWFINTWGGYLKIYPNYVTSDSLDSSTLIPHSIVLVQILKFARQHLNLTE
jgi:hypothetical protein